MKKTIVKAMAGLTLTTAGLAAVQVLPNASLTQTVSADSKIDVTKLSKVKKAKALLKSFETGDTSVAEKVLDKNYKQHNQTVPDGLEGFKQIMKQSKDAGGKTTVDIKRQIVDGNTVALQSVYDFSGQKMVGFDVFRFDKKGKIVEHWDNLTSLRDKENQSGHTQVDGVAKVDKSVDSDKTRQLVTDYVTDIVMAKNPDKLESYFDGDNYIQHNPDMVDTVTGFKQSLEQMKQMGINMDYDKVQKVVAQGDFALVMSEGNLAGKHTAFYDLYRVKDGKIAEHWDATADIVEDDKAANTNGKF